MKRLAVILGGLMVLTAFAYPVFAYGPGWGWAPGGGHPMWGRGHHMGGYGPGPGYCRAYGGNLGDLTTEQQKQLDDLEQGFFNETEPLRNDLFSKSQELGALLNQADPDPEKAKTLQKEINDLRTKIGEKQLDYDLKVRKILPGEGYGKGFGKGVRGQYGRGFGRGAYGHPMWGRGHHMGGYGPGPGYCWR